MRRPVQRDAVLRCQRWESGTDCSGSSKVTDDELELVLTHQQTPMFRMALLALGDVAAAQDAVASAMVNVWERARSHDVENVGGYLRVAVLNEIRNDSRRRRRAVRAWSRAASRHHTDDHATLIVAREQIQAALQQLPRDQRLCVVLRHYVGLDVAETAALLDAPHGTVTSWTARGLDRLRSHLEMTR
jgi:RNA polymerase sigma factor (sigma-70 family)